MPHRNARLVSPVSISKSLEDALAKAMRMGGIENLLVTRGDGLPIAHNFTDPDRAKHLAAMSAAVVGAARMAAEDLAHGDVKGVSIDAEGGEMICMQAGSQAIVAALGPPEANLGLILLAVRELAARVAAVIEELESEAANVDSRHVVTWEDPSVP